ncbi:TVP38/TMEM64 family protein [Rossellomorea aquimaris]|uniref:TVP38/TMEM64 family protein n=1 Tax=Rossellomorea aquimaris TaxID=189382 RepID=UPI0007D05958|nr:VTT domain-containing protein [Rossellomorea aquimaris]
MESYLLDLFKVLGDFAIALSIILNIFISVLGVVPSVVITAVNIKFFGFENGLFISIIGEALGSIVSFYLYRKGINKLLNSKEITNKYVTKLMKSRGIEAFCMIIFLRVFPFIPSGIVTLAAAISKVGIINYSVASTIGKIPSLVIEAYSIQQVLIWNWKGKGILCLFLLFSIWFIYSKSRGKK